MLICLYHMSNSFCPSYHGVSEYGINQKSAFAGRNATILNVKKKFGENPGMGWTVEHPQM